MWTLREKKAPSRLRPALITVNLQRHSHQKYHPGIFLFTSCRSSSVTFNLYKHLPFENLSFPHLSLNKSPPVFLLHSSFCQLLLAIPCLGSFPSQPFSPLWSFSLPERGTSAFPWNKIPGSPGRSWAHSWRWALCLEKQPELAQQNCMAVIKDKAKHLKSCWDQNNTRASPEAQKLLQEI